jgi:CDP-glycerol glycerophosphotransferase (TagB/SpsB family)
MKWLKKLLKFELSDLVSLIMIICAYPFAIIMRYIEKDIWIISERPDDARDNGYHLYKYIRENHPDKKAFYAINTKSKDFQKIERYRNHLEFGSFKHYIYYLAADKNISSHIGTGEPNGKLCLNLEIMGLIKNKKIFLQHGVIKDHLNFALYKNCKVRIFVCGAEPEYKFVTNEFGYPKGWVKYLGLCRFDNLHNFVDHTEKKKILIMPTWRQWLDLNEKDFLESEYYKRYFELLNHKDLHSFLTDNDIEALFYLHDNMQKYHSHFTSKCNNIIVAHKNDYDIQNLIKEASLLITDYSSVFFDFAYMRKPTIYYQFDISKYRSGHYKEGYFKYERDSFGPISYEFDHLIKELNNYKNNNFQMSISDKRKADTFFPLYDNKNCKRNFDVIDAL